MDNPTAAIIRVQLSSLLAGQIAYDDFWEWIAPLQFTVGDDGSATKLLYQIIGRLDEYEHGDWVDQQLWALLAALLSSECQSPQGD